MTMTNDNGNAYWQSDAQCVKGAFFLRRNDDTFTGITQKTCTIAVE